MIYYLEISISISISISNIKLNVNITIYYMYIVMFTFKLDVSSIGCNEGTHCEGEKSAKEPVIEWFN